MINGRRGPAAGGLALALLTVIACSPAPLDNTQPSPEALAREVLAAVAQHDEARLDALALNEEEFRRHVWPSLPAARPERNLPFSYVWGDLRQKSHQRRRATLATHRGRTYRLQQLTFSGGITEYPGFRVHRDALIKVRDSGGSDHEVALFGSAIEQDGRWKVFSYNVD